MELSVALPTIGLVLPGNAMSSVYLLRAGSGPRRVARSLRHVDLWALERNTRRRTVWFITDVELPSFQDSRAAGGKPPTYVVVEVSAHEITLRFDRPGFWLFRSLKPSEFDAIIDDMALAVD